MVRRRLTPVGKLFVGLMLLFYVASVTSQSGLLLLLIGLIGGCFIVTWSFSTRNVKFLRVTAPGEVYLVEGSKPTQPWRFENTASKHAEIVEVLHEEKVLFRIPAVKTKESISLAPDIVYQKRGVYPNASVIITSAAPYGLLRASRELQLPGEVVVFPKIYGVDAPVGMGMDFMAGGKFRGNRRVNSGSHFAGVRAWQSGDSLKQVHWKSTARRGEMMVKTFEEELGGRVSLILDCSAGNEQEVDNAVRAAASLAVATLQEGHQLEFCDLTGMPIQRLAPFSDESQLMEQLARYKVPTAVMLPDIEDLWRRSSIALVGTRWEKRWEPIINAARDQRRAVYVYLPKGAKAKARLDIELQHFGDNEIDCEPVWENSVS